MDSIIFDLDGTLWDSRATIVKAWNSVLEKQSGIPRGLKIEDLQKVMGLQRRELGNALFPELGAKNREEVLDACFGIEGSFLREVGGVLYPVVEQVLESLSQKYDLFIVSNCEDGYIEAFFDYHGLGHHFKDYENPGRTGLSKGENIKIVMERNNLSAPVYVGDTEGDRTAAVYARVPFIYAAYGFGTAHTYDAKISRIKELPSCLKIF
ncbi:HAD family hydrolase [Alteribacter natronophilus]|uniref:HAD family hydrolase n=1 Tax=Alteribacter natronophilus TaxID=2583810 RepID=UPI00110DFB1E|nr:HAD family hydrolase [Alteribacter natronophilus]TMW70354.1 HAD family hydrolase [Alteribacter natronophilus]